MNKCIKCEKDTLNPKYCSVKCSLSKGRDRSCKSKKRVTIKCLRCGKDTKKSKHCSWKCRKNPPKYITCAFRDCKKECLVGKWKRKRYCDNKCLQGEMHCRYIESWLEGNKCGYNGKTIQLSPHVRRWLRENRGSACSECSWDEHHPSDGNILTEIDHIDGDAKNNTPDNLRILCPNCHSMTPTFRARNKNSKRDRN